MKPPTNHPLVPMDAAGVEADYERAITLAAKEVANKRARGTRDDLSRVEQHVRRAEQTAIRAGLPADLANRLTDLQTVRADAIKECSTECLEGATDHLEVAMAFRGRFEHSRVQLGLQMRLSDVYLPSGEKVEPPVDELERALLGKPTARDDANEENPLVELEDKLTLMAYNACRHTALKAPIAWALTCTLYKSSPFLAGFALGSLRLPRGRPAGPTRDVATRVWAVDALCALCSLAVSESLEVWNTWFPDHALDDAHQFRKEKSVVAMYLKIAETVDPLCDPEMLAVVAQAWRAWQDDQEAEGHLTHL
jgi:hypothetical protein